MLSGGGIKPPHISTRKGNSGKPEASDRTRTCDLIFTKDLLYQLSYGGEATREGLEPSTDCLEGSCSIHLS